MATTLGDILLNNQPYLLVPNGWQRMESIRTQPRATFRAAREFHRADAWNWWGMSDFFGMGVDNYVGDGPFAMCRGLDLSTPGQFDVAKKLAFAVAETTSTSGWIAFTVQAGPSGPRAIFASKNLAKLWYSDDTGTTYTLVTSPFGASGIITAWGTGLTPAGTSTINYWVSTSDGHLWTTTDGNTWTDKGTPGTGACYFLGEFRGKLYLGHSNGKLYTFDGTTFVEVFVGQLGTPIRLGAVGNGYLHLMTRGPRLKLYITDGTTLYNVQELRTDFQAEVCVFLDTLWVFGAKSLTASGAGTGAIWRLGGSGLEPVFEWGDDATYAWDIDTAIIDGDRLLWTARIFDEVKGSGTFNQPIGSGIGVFDPGLDLFDDYTMGFYVGGYQTTDTGVPSGMTRVNDVLLYGVRGKGFFKETTPGPYIIVSSLFDGLEPNVRHLWGQAAVKSSALLTGQTVNFAARRASQNFVSEAYALQSGGAVGNDSHMWQSPANYYSAEVQFTVSGDANGSALTIFDVSMSFISVPEIPKREWDLVIDCAGSATKPQRMRDGSANTRTSMQQIAALNALWNTQTTYEDVDGSTYTVILKGPRERDQDMHRILSGTVVTDFRTRYRVHLTEM